MIFNDYLDESGVLWHQAYSDLSKELGIMNQTRYTDHITRNDTALILIRTYRDQQYMNDGSHYVLDRVQAL